MIVSSQTNNFPTNKSAVSKIIEKTNGIQKLDRDFVHKSLRLNPILTLKSPENQIENINMAASRLHLNQYQKLRSGNFSPLISFDMSRQIKC